MKSLHGLTEKGNEITNAVRTEVLAVVETSRQLRGQVESGVERVRDRLGDLEALYDVVEEEVEETALSVASALRRFREGAGVVTRLKRTVTRRRRR
jgi:acetylornithine/succinyldiaminopimelate/putrescine aminotransferase